MGLIVQKGANEASSASTVALGGQRRQTTAKPEQSISLRRKVAVQVFPINSHLLIVNDWFYFSYNMKKLE